MYFISITDGPIRFGVHEIGHNVTLNKNQQNLDMNNVEFQRMIQWEGVYMQLTPSLFCGPRNVSAPNKTWFLTPLPIVLSFLVHWLQDQRVAEVLMEAAGRQEPLDQQDAWEEPGPLVRWDRVVALVFADRPALSDGEDHAVNLVLAQSVSITYCIL